MQDQQDIRKVRFIDPETDINYTTLETSDDDLAHRGSLEGVKESQDHSLTLRSRKGKNPADVDEKNIQLQSFFAKRFKLAKSYLRQRQLTDVDEEDLKNYDDQQFKEHIKRFFAKHKQSKLAKPNLQQRRVESILPSISKKEYVIPEDYDSTLHLRNDDNISISPENKFAALLATVLFITASAYHANNPERASGAALFAAGAGFMAAWGLILYKLCMRQHYAPIEDPEDQREHAPEELLAEGTGHHRVSARRRRDEDRAR